MPRRSRAWVASSDNTLMRRAGSPAAIGAGHVVRIGVDEQRLDVALVELGAEPAGDRV